MTKIPTPFIGGSNGPPRPSEDDQKLEPPFVPMEEPEAHAEPESGYSEAELPKEPEPRTSSPTASSDGPIRVPVLEFEPSETVGTSEPESPGGGVPTQVSEDWERDERTSETAEAAELASEVTRATQEAERAAGALDLPDFLLASDSPSADATQAAVGPQAEVLPEGAESEATILEAAEELGGGRLGPWIARLCSELGVHGVEVAIRRAFAAGYLAGKREKE